MKAPQTIIMGIIWVVLSLYFATNSFTQETPPLVYDVEFTGVDCTKPPLPDFADLPVVKPLTDPYEWSDGSGRDTTFAGWTRRRAEIKAELEQYEIGPKPDRPDTISASYENDSLKVNITVNGQTLTLNSVITLPEGEGPFPAIISIPPWPFALWSYAGSLPADIFTSRDIASVTFNFWDVMQHTQVRGAEPINNLYPDLAYMGAYSAWSWGVSRLIDGLELVSGDLAIDLTHLAVTGCSFAGKMALWAGALDERIALTIPQESGGGGVAAWRVSNTLGSVENIGATSNVWFLNSMKNTFNGTNVSKLPMDHHELVAMVAPRALLNLGNPSQVWLAEESGYVSSVAARKVWENFGIADRMGYSFNADHGHCVLPEVQKPEVEAFVDRFLLGDTTVNTEVMIHEYDDVIPEYWFDWWGTGVPEFAELDRGESDEVWFEAECADVVGAAWNVRLDTLASNESYAVPKDGLSSLSAVPADDEAVISFPFTINNNSTYYLYGKVNCLRGQDTYWLKMDDGSFTAVGGLITEGWEWKEFTSFNLTAGEHTLAIAYRLGGAKLDKICISEFNYPPGKMGEPATNLCTPDTTTQFYTTLNQVDVHGYTLGQNYPNPFNNNTTIAFEIPRNTHVSLKVYSILGEEIEELAGMEYTTGKHTVKFDAQNLSNGVYFYTLKADRFSVTRKMIIQAE